MSELRVLWVRECKGPANDDWYVAAYATCTDEAMAKQKLAHFESLRNGVKYRLVKYTAEVCR